MMTIPKGGVLDTNESEVHAEQVIRLLNSMKQLSQENAKLLQEQEEWQRIKSESAAQKELMERFRIEFRKRCEDVRSELINFRNRHPHEANPANGVHTKKEVQRIQDLENMVRALYVKIEKQKKSIDKQA